LERLALQVDCSNAALLGNKAGIEAEMLALQLMTYSKARRTHDYWSTLISPVAARA
jgi:hypothetical protein